MCAFLSEDHLGGAGGGCEAAGGAARGLLLLCVLLRVLLLLLRILGQPRIVLGILLLARGSLCQSLHLSILLHLRDCESLWERRGGERSNGGGGRCRRRGDYEGATEGGEERLLKRRDLLGKCGRGGIPLFEEDHESLLYFLGFVQSTELCHDSLFLLLGRREAFVHDLGLLEVGEVQRHL
jgi:hypothetical protein